MPYYNIPGIKDAIVHGARHLLGLQKTDSTANASASSGNVGGRPVRNSEREKPKWEDTITNRMMKKSLSYSAITLAVTLVIGKRNA